MMVHKYLYLKESIIINSNNKNNKNKIQNNRLLIKYNIKISNNKQIKSKTNNKTNNIKT